MHALRNKIARNDTGPVRKGALLIQTDQPFFKMFGGNIQKLIQVLPTLPMNQWSYVLASTIEFLRLDAPRAELRWILEGCCPFLSGKSGPGQQEIAVMIAKTILQDPQARARLGKFYMAPLALKEIQKLEKRSVLPVVPTAEPTEEGPLLGIAFGARS